MKSKQLALLLIFILYLTGCSAEPPILIAVVGPAGTDTGDSIKQGVSLYLENINHQGGIKGRKLEFDFYDDQDDPDKAVKIAEEIINQKQYYAVIGHRTSAASMSAGKLYHKAGLPVISPMATADRLTLDNNWYFRSIFNNNLQGQVVADYISQIAGFSRGILIYEDDAYGKNLADSFYATMENMENNQKNRLEQWSIHHTSPNKIDQNSLDLCKNQLRNYARFINALTDIYDQLSWYYRKTESKGALSRQNLDQTTRKKIEQLVRLTSRPEQTGSQNSSETDAVLYLPKRTDVHYQKLAHHMRQIKEKIALCRSIKSGLSLFNDSMHRQWDSFISRWQNLSALFIRFDKHKEQWDQVSQQPEPGVKSRQKQDLHELMLQYEMVIGLFEQLLAETYTYAAVFFKNGRLRDQPEFIFLSVHDTVGAELVRFIKENRLDLTIFLPDSCASRDFSRSLSDLKKNNLGFSSRLIYVVTPFLKDTGNKKAGDFISQYQSKFKQIPFWSAACSYDAAGLLCQALEKCFLSSSLTEETLKTMRKAIRQALLENNSPYTSFEGVTGMIYFDAHGNARKPVLLGIFQNGQIVSAPIQLSTSIQGQALKTLAVYTGIELNKISRINMKDQTCDIDFNLWFRYYNPAQFKETQGIIPENIIFINAVVPLSLLPPHQKKKTHSINKQIIEPLVYKEQDNYCYSLYHVQGTFSLNFMPWERELHESILGFSFRNNSTAHSHLIYIRDIIGMRLLEGEELEKAVLIRHILKSSNQYRPKQQSVFQSILKQSSLGDLSCSALNRDTKDYSRFNFILTLDQIKFNIRGLLSKQISFLLFIFTGINLFLCAAVYSVYLFFKKSRAAHQLIKKMHIRKIYRIGMRHIDHLIQNRGKYLILYILICLFIFTIATEFFIINYIKEHFYFYRSLPLTVYSLIWWIFPAFLVDFIIHQFILVSIEEQIKQEIPAIFKNLLSICLYLFISIAILAFVFHKKITTLLATSGIVAAVIGFALQFNISDVFSAIFVYMESPFKINDFVQIGQYKGKVIDIQWRTTIIKNYKEEVIRIPNHTVAAAEIITYSEAHYYKRKELNISFSSFYPPQTIKTILTNIALSCVRIKENPPPQILFKGLIGQHKANYAIHFIEAGEGGEEVLWLKIWRTLKLYGITQDFSPPDQPLAGIPRPKLFCQIDLFKTLTEEEKKYLQSKMTPQTYYAWQEIFKEGDQGSSMFIIGEGAVAFYRKKQNQEVIVNKMGAGEFFGEMALLTGQPRAATARLLSESLLYEINKEELLPLLQKNRAIANKLAEIVIDYKKQVEKFQNDLNTREKEKKSVFNNIMRFFGIKT